MPYRVGNNHYREERDQRGEQQAVNKNDQPGLFQVLQLGMLDFAVHLGQRLFTAHGQHRMPETDKQNDHRQVAEPGFVEPAQRFFIQAHHAGV